MNKKAYFIHEVELAHEMHLCRKLNRRIEWKAHLSKPSIGGNLKDSDDYCFKQIFASGLLAGHQGVC